MRNFTILALAAMSFPLAACNGADPANITADEAEVFDGIAADETLYFGGTEPFWGGEVAGTRLTYTTPEDPEGQTITVKRFAGLGGMSFSGEMDVAGNVAAFDMAVTPGDCSDGMSDRTYPFSITLQLGDELRNGCGHTDAQPFAGAPNP